jgi:hypothetical protein
LIFALTLSIYQPKLRLGIRPANLHGYLTASASAPRAKAREAENESVPIPPTLLGLFKLLPTVSSSRDAAVRFVRRHGIWAGEGGRGAAPREGENEAETGAETPFETFCRLLQRNLNGGWSARTLKKVTWHAVDVSHHFYSFLTLRPRRRTTLSQRQLLHLSDQHPHSTRSRWPWAARSFRHSPGCSKRRGLHGMPRANSTVCGALHSSMCESPRVGWSLRIFGFCPDSGTSLAR